MFMFRSTHDKLVKSLQDDYNYRINAIEKKALDAEEEFEAKMEAQKNVVRTMKSTIEEMRAIATQGAFKREPRDIAATLVRAVHSIDRAALKYPNWDKLPEEYRDMFYDIVYKLLGKPRTSSKKSAKHST